MADTHFIDQEMVESIMLDLTGEAPFQQVDKELRFTCPFCRSEHNKFYISVNKGVWICYNCGMQGNLVTLAANYLGVTRSEAYDYLTDFGFDYSAKDTKPKYYSNQDTTSTTFYDQLMTIKYKPAVEEQPVEDNKTMPPLPSNTKPLMVHSQDPEAFPYFQYLHTRGISLQQIKQENIQYCTSGTFRRLDGTSSTLNSSLVFLTYGEDGRPVYWNTRVIYKGMQPKSVNAPNQPLEHGRKDSIWHLNTIKQGDSVVLVEGVFNGLTVEQAGFRAVATFGKNVTDTQLHMLIAKSKQMAKLILYLDDDAMPTMLKLADRLLANDFPPAKLFIVKTPYKGADANDLGPEKTKEVLTGHILPYNFLTNLSFYSTLQ